MKTMLCRDNAFGLCLILSLGLFDAVLLGFLLLGGLPTSHRLLPPTGGDYVRQVTLEVFLLLAAWWWTTAGQKTVTVWRFSVRYSILGLLLAAPSDLYWIFYARSPRINAEDAQRMIAWLAASVGIYFVSAALFFGFWSLVFKAFSRGKARSMV